jgi:hypothetical protein
MVTLEDAIARFAYYVCSGLLIGVGAGLQWGFPCFLLALGVVLLLWVVLVDIRVVLPVQLKKWSTAYDARARTHGSPQRDGKAERSAQA